MQISYCADAADAAGTETEQLEVDQLMHDSFDVRASSCVIIAPSFAADQRVASTRVSMVD